VQKQYGMSDRSKAMAAAENILTAHPDLDGIFASTEPSSVGTALALNSRKQAGKIRFVAFDASEGMVEDLKRGTIDALVAQDPFRIGYEAVQTLVDKLHGKTPPKRIMQEAWIRLEEIRILLWGLGLELNSLAEHLDFCVEQVNPDQDASERVALKRKTPSLGICNAMAPGKGRRLPLKMYQSPGGTLPHPHPRKAGAAPHPRQSDAT